MKRREMVRRSVWMLACVVTLWGGPLTPADAADRDAVIVFAAASTTNALNEIGDLFAAGGTDRLAASFASSSTLAKQIENGAPASIFISADEKWMDYLEQRKLIVPASRIDLLSNRLVLVAPSGGGAPVEIRPGFDLAGLLGDGRLAMGDPDHVPAGTYGKQALEQLGVWDGVKEKIARAKDVRAALALVERGEAPLGVVYASDAVVTDKVKVVGTFPEASHPPIVYPAAVVAGNETAAAARLMHLLKTPEAVAVFEKYGFTVRP